MSLLIKKILNKLKDLDVRTKDTGWQIATLTDDFKCYNDDNSNIPRYRKIGKLVEVNGAVSPAITLPGSASGVTIFRLPERIPTISKPILHLSRNK